MAYETASINERSSVGIGESMNLFEMPSVDIGVSKVRYVEYKPLNQLNQDVGLEFEVPNSGSQYIDLRRTYLMCKVRIKKQDGSDLTSPQFNSSEESPGEGPVTPAPVSPSNVGPVNNFLHSMYSQVDIYLQKKLVTTSNANYAYEAYFNTLLKYDRPAKETHLESQLYIKDVGNMDDGNALSGGNNSLSLRALYTSGSKTVDMMGPIMSDVCWTNRYLLNGIELKIRLWPSNPAFHLMSSDADPKYKTELVDASLSVCMVTPTPETLLSHQELMVKKKWLAVYPYLKTDVKKYSISKGHYCFCADNVYLGSVPTRLIMGLVSEEATNGTFSKNPFNFTHYNLKYLNVTVDGESVPEKALNMTFGNNVFESNYIEAYTALYGRERYNETRDGGLFISRSDFAKGYTVFAFDMEPDIRQEEDGTVWPTFKKGNLRITMNFAKALPHTVSLILYATFPTLFKVDYARSVVIS